MGVTEKKMGPTVTGYIGARVFLWCSELAYRYAAILVVATSRWLPWQNVKLLIHQGEEGRFVFLSPVPLLVLNKLNGAQDVSRNNLPSHRRLVVMQDFDFT